MIGALFWFSAGVLACLFAPPSWHDPARQRVVRIGRKIRAQFGSDPRTPPR